MKSGLLVVTALLSLIGWNMAYATATQHLETALFAGGCFWCLESDLQRISGVKEAVFGYTGGAGADPTYEDYGKKGHIEAVQITYDPSVLSYEKLLQLFWRLVDPVDAGGQFCDRGHAYSSAIFYRAEEQKLLAEQSKAALERSARFNTPIATALLKAEKFYEAEEYHQNYAKKNPIRYRFYRFNCGRDRRLNELWGDRKEYAEPPGGRVSKYTKPSQKELKKKLLPT